MVKQSIEGAKERNADNPMAQALKLKLNYDQLTNCIRCGFCLPACPTYRETGKEAASPRGRIALMKAVVDDVMEPDQAFQEQIDLCIGCRACEAACPADVKYGQLLEETRDAIEDHRAHPWWIRLVRKAAFRWIFPRQNRLRIIGFLLRAYQKSGLQKLARLSGLLRLFPRHLREMENILPAASARGVLEQLGAVVPAKGTKRGTVGMFRGCIMDVLFTDTNVNTVKLLAEAGFDVVIPPAQNCCGALHAHSGERDGARELARKNVRAFREAGVDYIVTNAGGCGALLIEYDHLLKDDPEYAVDARWFASRVRDVCQLLLEKGADLSFAEPAEHAPATISYQDSCHLRNVMKASAPPRQLMLRVKNTRYAELHEADRCCGSGGIYNLVQPEMSGQILDHKMENVRKTGAQYLLHSNPGCLLQMKSGIARHGMADRIKAVHIVDFLYDRLQR